MLFPWWLPLGLSFDKLHKQSKPFKFSENSLNDSQGNKGKKKSGKVVSWDPVLSMTSISCNQQRKAKHKAVAGI